MQQWILQWWAAALFGAVTTAAGTALTGLWKKQKAFGQALCALLFDRMKTSYLDMEQKGYATLEDKQSMESFYMPYHLLGGNGTGTEMRKRVQEMPDRPPAKLEVV